MRRQHGSAVPDRVTFAVELLDPRPGQRLLEIGCGPGVAAALVCDRIAPTGHLLAVDRSAAAVTRTVRRNAAHLAAGRLTVLNSRLADLDDHHLPPGGLDAAIAVDVNLFWTRRRPAELALLAGALRAGGRLHVCYGDGPTDPGRVTGAVAAALADAGFRGVAVTDGPGGTAVSGTAPPAA